jgi:hypothetical protein
MQPSTQPSLEIPSLLNEYAERQRKQLAEVQNMPLMVEEENEESESDAQDNGVPPIYNQYLGFGGEQGIVTMTNFTDVELRVLFGVVEESFNRYYARGRGRKPVVQPFDAFFFFFLLRFQFSSICKSGKKQHLIGK